jgi:hypothetical protein
VRVNPKGVSEKSIESDIAAGEIQGSALDTFKALVADLYLPVLQEQGSWGKMAADHTQEFLAGKVVSAAATAHRWAALHITGGMRCMARAYNSTSCTGAAYKISAVSRLLAFCHGSLALRHVSLLNLLRLCPAGTDKIASVLVDASGCLQGGVELRLPDEKFASQYELKPASFNQAANEPAVAKHLEECLGDWCNQVSTCWLIGAALCGTAGACPAAMRTQWPAVCRHCFFA